MKYFHIDKFDTAVGTLAVCATLIFIPVLTYFYFAQDLESKELIMNKNGSGLTLLDQNGKPFFQFYEAKNRSIVPLSSIPKQTQEAVIASEDKDFYYHQGFSAKSIARSLFLDVKQGELNYGGSTITQQLVKNTLLKPTKSFLRKYQEFILAQEIERRYSKQEILEMYLNSVYFGRGAFGIQEAAQAYFNKDAADLNLAQSALLISLLPSPTTYSQKLADQTAILSSEKRVLDKMVALNYLTKDDEQAALDLKVQLKTPQNQLNQLAPHFALMIRDQLIDKYGEEKISRSGFKVTTTLDPNWQQYAENTVKNQVERLSVDRVSNGAAVVLDPKTGAVKALVGSSDWDNDQFGKVNIATSLRQPGSSFKPIVYSAAMEEGLITPATILKDQPLVIKTSEGDYKPEDYDKRFRGPVTVRRALANSLNIPAVEVIQSLGVSSALSKAKEFGITSLKDPSDYGPSLVLGAAEVPLLEMTSAYGVFANNGQLTEPILYTKIEDKNGQVIDSVESKSKEVLKPEIAFLISSILSDSSARAEEFGNLLNISRPAAVKTGTTEDYRDSWTIGYTPSLVVGVWVGNNDGTPMDNVAGSLGAAPIWKALMEHYLAGTPVEKFEPDDDLVKLAICPNGGIAKEATTSAHIEYFVKGTQPNFFCSLPKPSSEPPVIEVKAEDKDHKENESTKESRED